MDTRRALITFTLLTLLPLSARAADEYDPGDDPPSLACLDKTSGTFYATATQVQPGQSSTLVWSVRAGCTGVKVSITGFGLKPLTGTQAVGPFYAPKSWNLTASYLGASKKLGSASVRVIFPVVDGKPTVTITGGDSNQQELFLYAIAQPNTRVHVQNHVVMDLTGKQNIGIERGVHILGTRSPSQLGPYFFTTSSPKILFMIGEYNNADDVRISGLRIDGRHLTPDADSGGDHGIWIQSSLNVEIDNNHIFGWHGAGVRVKDTRGRMSRANGASVRIHDNMITQNMNDGTDGYGVDIGEGAYALIDRNVFDSNRHAIAAGSDLGTGYFAYRNLVLEHPGGNDTHQFDVHGDEDCYLFPIPYPWDQYCGRAGEFFDYRYNTMLYTAGTAIKVRGEPTEGGDITRNVFAHSDVYGGWIESGAIVQTEGHNVGQWDNLFGADPMADIGHCDIDGDSVPDRFLATGNSWWYSPGLDPVPYTPERWFFLNTSNLVTSDLTLADGGLRCDVIANASGAVYSGGKPHASILFSGASNQLGVIRIVNGAFTPIAGIGTIDSSRVILGKGDFDHDYDEDLVTRDVNYGTIYVTIMENGVPVQHVQRGVLPDASLAGVGHFDNDGHADLLWRHPDGRVSIWFRGEGLRSTFIGWWNVPNPVGMEWQIKGVGDFNGDGSDDILWRHSNGQVSRWFMQGSLFIGDQLVGGTDPYGQWQVDGIGDFDGDGADDVLWRATWGPLVIWFRGSDASAKVVSFQNGGGITSTVWKVKAISDMNGDGRADIVWHRQDIGEVATWMLNGDRYLWEPPLTTISTSWSFVATLVPR